MKITAKMFVDGLADYLTEARNIDNSALEYDTVRLVFSGHDKLEPQHAYVITEDELCKISEIDPSCLLIIAGLPPSDLNCPTLACSGTLAAIYERSTQTLEHYNRLERNLNAALLEDKELDVWLSICAEFFGSVTQLLDPAFNIVAGVGPVFENGQLVRFDRFESDFTANIVSEMSKQNLLKVTYAFKSAQYYKSEMFSQGAVHYNIFDENSYIGKLLLIEQEKPVTPGVIDAVDRVGRYFRHLMIRRKTTLNVSLFTTEYFLSEILAGRIRDGEFIQSQLSGMEWAMHDTYRIACISVMAQEAIGFYVQALRKSLTHAVVFPLENFVVAIFHLSSKKSTLHEQQLVRFLNEARLQAGLSEIFNDFHESKVFYVQSKYALKLGVQSEPSQIIFHYEHYVMAHVITALTDQNFERAIMHPAIFVIRDYDSQNGTEFLQTLKVYLACEGNQTLTADQLHIHRNSLKYRLSRLHDMIGDDLDEPDQRLRMQISFQMTELFQSNSKRSLSQTT